MCADTVKLDVLYGLKWLEAPRYSIKVERLGGLPFRYWVATQFNYLGRFGPFYSYRKAAEIWIMAG